MAAMSTAIKRIKRNKLPTCTYSVLIEVYSGIARFPCDSTAFLFNYYIVVHLCAHTGIYCILSDNFICKIIYLNDSKSANTNDLADARESHPS